MVSLFFVIFTSPFSLSLASFNGPHFAFCLELSKPWRYHSQCSPTTPILGQNSHAGKTNSRFRHAASVRSWRRAVKGPFAGGDSFQNGQILRRRKCVRLTPRARKKTSKRDAIAIENPIPKDSDVIPYPFASLDGPAFVQPLTEESQRLAIGNNILWGHCDNIAYMLERCWPKIGWQLQCLRTPKVDREPNAIFTALDPLRGETGCDLIAPFLRRTSVLATRHDLQETSKDLASARQRLRIAHERYDSEVAKCHECEKAVFEAGPENRRFLQEAITLRIANLLVLREACQTAESSLVALQKIRRELKPPPRQTIEIEITAVKTEHSKAQQDLEAEEKILRDLRRRHDAATKVHLAWAKEELEKNRTALAHSEDLLQECRGLVRRIETLYEDQSAGFARKDFLKFVEQKRCLHRPGQLAKAMAGLPALSARDSFSRCGKSPYTREPHPNYELFEVIARALERRDPQLSEDPFHLLQDEISRLPPTRIWNGQKVPNFIRDKFQSYRQELREALQECLRLKSLPNALPYLITGKFLDNISRKQRDLQQETALERVLKGRLKNDR